MERIDHYLWMLQNVTSVWSKSMVGYAQTKGMMACDICAVDDMVSFSRVGSEK